MDYLDETDDTDTTGHSAFDHRYPTAQWLNRAYGEGMEACPISGDATTIGLADGTVLR